MRLSIKIFTAFALMVFAAALFTSPAPGFVVSPLGADTAKDAKNAGHGNKLAIIVIDPGHGGDDTGAIGSSGKKEKDITLSVALELEKQLKKNTKARVILTRRDDSYITLEERTAIANKKNADIFISIHANSARRKAASGVETFFMSVNATDDEARELAAIENNAGADDGANGTDEQSDFLKKILWDLARNVAHHESSRLAQHIHERLTDGIGVKNRGIKQAPFRVLAGADMPAVLVEVGFISNPKEERRLASKKARALIASYITIGVMEFEKKLSGTKQATGANKGASRHNTDNAILETQYKKKESKHTNDKKN